MRQKRVGVLMGGPSCERDVSIRSGKAVCKALEGKDIEVVPIELMSSGASNGYDNKIKEIIALSKIDVAFIALHGKFGEDGVVQGLLEELKVPYTGSRVKASRLGMDKIEAKKLFRASGVPVPRDEVLEQGDFNNGCDVGAYFKRLGSKLVIKPHDGGSSIGLDIVSNIADFHAAVKDAFKYSGKAMIEEYISGREVTVGIIEDRALPVVEIVPKRDFFDFTAKYQKGLTDYVVPAVIDKREYKLCQELALKAHKVLAARSFSRIDMILNEKRGPVALEVNTIPGLTETSLLPKAAQAAGIGFEELCRKILDSALW